MSLTEKYMIFLAVPFMLGAVATLLRYYVKALGDVVHNRVDNWRATRALYAIEIEFDATGANDEGRKQIVQVGKNALALWYKTPGVRAVTIIASSNSKV